MIAIASFVNVSVGDAARSDARRAPQRVGAVLSGLAVLFLLLDAVVKLLALPVVLQTSAELGLPATPAFAQGLGVLLLACTLLYVWPRTAVVGAVLLTGYLGGAIATHVRANNPLLTHVLFGLYVALFVWGGLYLRDPRVRALVGRR
ncbi:MAG TPA: DoxX family protein [Burkholderiaceae bacterium]